MANIKKIYASKIYTSATAPANPSAGSFWYDSTNDLVKRYNGTAWVQIDITKYNVVYNEQTVTLAAALNTIKTNIGTLGTELGELQIVVGDSTSGLVKGVADNASAITALGGRMDTAESDIDALESGKVDKTTTVNGKALSANVTLNDADIILSQDIGVTYAGEPIQYALVDLYNNKLGGANNLSELENYAAARTNLDVYSTSETGTQISTAITNAISTSVPADPTSAVDTKAASEKAVSTAIAGVKSSLAAALKYKGTKATYADLPATGNEVGDVWNVTAAYGTTPAGTNWAWDGSAWDALGGTVDLSPYQTSAITIDSTSTTVVAAISANKSAIDTHTANTSNPHSVTAAQVGLGNVDNTSDLNKPISTATQTALDLKQPKAISISGITATTVEGALAELDGAIDNVVSSLDDYVEKSSISTAIPASGAVDTKVASEKAVADGLATKAGLSADNTFTGSNTFTSSIQADGFVTTNGKVAIGESFNGIYLSDNTVGLAFSGGNTIKGLDTLVTSAGESTGTLSDSDNKVASSKLVTAELAKKADANASNIATNKAAWKTALGFIEAADVGIAAQTLAQNGTITLVAGKHYRFEGTTGINEIEVNIAGSEIYFELMSGAEIVSVADTLVATVSEACRVLTW